MAVGHALAKTDPATWERWQREWAMHIVRYYRRQLTEAGFDVDQILAGRSLRSPRSEGNVCQKWAPDPYGFAKLRLW